MLQLQRLSLSFNKISGTLPADWGQLGVFPELEGLYLEENQLTGACPKRFLPAHRVVCAGG